MSVTHDMNARQLKYYAILLLSAQQRGYSVIGSYKDSKTLIEMICDKGHTVQIRPNNFRSGYGCVKCSGLCPTESENTFMEIAKLRNYNIIEKYINNSTPVNAICPNGHHTKITPGDLKRNHGCNQCITSASKELEAISDSSKLEQQTKSASSQSQDLLVEIAQQRGYSVIGEYSASHKPIEMVCDNAHDLMITPANFKNGRGCAKCANLCPVESERLFTREIENRDFVLIGKYSNNVTPTEVICDQGHAIQVRPCHFKRGFGCPKCAKNCPFEAEKDLKQQAMQRGYKIMSEYVNTNTLIQMICDKDHEIWILPLNFKKGQGCGICNKSKGERLISSALALLQIPFKMEYRFPDSDRYYDFGFNSHYGGVVIEWDGIQHFSYVPYFHDKTRSFEDERANDLRKTTDVINRGHKIIRFNYMWIKRSIEETAEFISTAIESPELLIVSDPVMYSWLDTITTL